MPAGAGLLPYSDGVYEGFSEDGTRLGEQRFIDLAARLSTITDPADYLPRCWPRSNAATTVATAMMSALFYLTWPHVQAFIVGTDPVCLL